MANCSNCGKRLAAGATFCAECGTPVNNNVVCPACGVENAPENQTCSACGVALAAPQAEKKAPKISKKLIAIVAGALALIIVLALVIPAIFGGKYSAPDYAIFVKDGELVFGDFEGKNPGTMVITDDAGDVDEVYSSDFVVSKDGSILFYPQEINEDGTYTLMYKDADTSSKGTEITSGVQSYKINADGDKVLYLKNDKLYTYDVSKGESGDSIAKDVNAYRADEDLEKIVYRTVKYTDDGQEERLYFKNGEADAELIAKDIDSYTIDSDFENIYYEKEEKLYKAELTTKPEGEQIAKDVYSFYLYEDGKMYIVIEEEIEAEADEEEDDDYYYDDYVETQKKLYYYNGTEKTLVSENYSSMARRAYDAPVIVFAIYNDEEETHFYYVAIEGVAQTKPISDEEITDVSLTADGSVLYYIANVDEEAEVGDLYRVEITDGTVGKAEKYDTDVSTYEGLYVLNNEEVAYAKDRDSETGAATFYVNKTKLAEDCEGVAYNEAGDCTLYVTDGDDKNNTYTVWALIDGESVKIADEVYNISLLPSGNSLYIKDYSNGSGELYVWNGKDSQKVSSDVSEIIIPNYPW